MTSLKILKAILIFPVITTIFAAQGLTNLDLSSTIAQDSTKSEKASYPFRDSSNSSISTTTEDKVSDEITGEVENLNRIEKGTSIQNSKTLNAILQQDDLTRSDANATTATTLIETIDYETTFTSPTPTTSTEISNSTETTTFPYLNETNIIDKEIYYKYNLTNITRESCEKCASNKFMQLAGRSSVIVTVVFVTTGLIIIACITYRNIVKVIPIST